MTYQEAAALRRVADAMRSCGEGLPSSSPVGRQLTVGAAELLAVTGSPSPVATQTVDDVWKRTPRETRESLLFQVLGDERLTITQLRERLTDKVDSWIYDGEARGLVMRLFRAGQLEREPEQWRNRVRYRYSRKRTLDGPIADLERAYRDDDEAA